MSGFFGGGSSPNFILPAFISGKYYTSLNAHTAGSGSAMTANRIYAQPIMIGVAQAVTEIGCEVTSAAASSNIRLGIYGTNWPDPAPASLVLDAGVVSGGSTGSKTISISTTLQPGLYWTVCISDGAPSLRSDNLGSRWGWFGTDSPSSGSNNTFIQQNVSYGALASTFGTPTWASSALTFRVWLRNV